MIIFALELFSTVVRRPQLLDSRITQNVSTTALDDMSLDGKTVQGGGIEWLGLLQTISRS